MDFEGISITWLGHAGFLLNAEETNIYIDPYQIGRGRPNARYVLVTHDHYDHLSIEDIDKIATDDTVIVCPSDCTEKLHDLPGTVRGMKAGDTIELGDVTVEAVPAYNANKKFHPKENGWIGYVVTVGGVRVYHSGDSDNIPEMADVECDVALLPVSGTYVMNPEEAAKAADTIKPKVAIPMHWGSFIGDASDAEAFKKAAKVKVEILERE